MTNGEKYRDEIFREYGSSSNFCKEFIQKRILGTDNCDGKTCTQCQLMQMVWLNEEYKEPEVDWSKVEVDTPIFVSQYPILHLGVALSVIFQSLKTKKCSPGKVVAHRFPLLINMIMRNGNMQN